MFLDFFHANIGGTPIFSVIKKGENDIALKYNKLVLEITSYLANVITHGFVHNNRVISTLLKLKLEH